MSLRLHSPGDQWILAPSQKLNLIIHTMKTSRVRLAVFHIFAAFAVIAHADDGFVFSGSGGAPRWRAPVTWPSVQLRLSADNVAPYEQNIGSSSQFSLPLTGMPDGTYKWEVVAGPVMSPALAQSLAAARKSGNDAAAADILAAANLPKGVRTSGAFSILNGQLLQPDAVEPAPAAKEAVAPAANTVQSIPLSGESAPLAPDVVNADDFIVQGSLAVGLDTVNNENFGFDTIRLKENNTRIHFDDTSTAAGFPANDWRIIINDSASGGASYFAIEDSTANRVPFKISAGARANALFVSSTSKVGLGTSTPVLDVHITTGNTPATRFEQDNTQGFTPQTWDVAGNEANFFVRDVTGGSKLPFRIRPGAPTSSLDVGATGNVGLGQASPATKLHLTTATTDVAVRLEQAGTVPSKWDLTNNAASGRLNITDDTTAARVPVKVGPNAINNLFRVGVAATNTVDVNGTLTVNGTFNNLSSREYKDILPGVDSAAVLEKLSSLPLFTWSYKESGGERHFGPVAEDFYAHFRLGTDERHISPNDMAGIALGAIKGLHKQLRERDAEINSLRQKSDTLEKQLKALTEAVDALKVGSPAKASP